MDCFSMFGTNSFNLVWERAYANVLNNQLERPIGILDLPVPLAKEYRNNPRVTLKELIEKPKWVGYATEYYEKQAADTLIPDLVTISNHNGEYQFLIFDAKYYNIRLEKNKPLGGQPGIESITKQFLYQLAYMPFVQAHNIKHIYNCFLMPTESKEVICKGYTSLDMLESLGLERIEVRLLPAEKVFANYLDNRLIDISELNLNN